MLGGDERRLKLAFSLMFALPGTPVLWYGDEIGMGDDLSLPERNSVRTPMQWSDEPSAGFSDAPADKLVRPVVTDEPFDYRRVNVAAQHDVPGSLMEHVQRLVRTRRAAPEIGWGEMQVLDTAETGVLRFALRLARRDALHVPQPRRPPRRGAPRLRGRAQAPPALQPRRRPGDARRGGAGGAGAVRVSVVPGAWGAAVDKDFIVVEGAVHGMTPCQPYSAATGHSDGNATKNLHG